MKHAGLLRSLLIVTIVYFLALCWGAVVLLRCLVRMVTRGPRAFFTWHTLEERPRCLDDPDLGIHGYVRLQKSGVRLHYVKAGDDNKPLMVLLHGLPEIWYSWRHQIAEFQQDYRVVAADMRGYGESDKPAGRRAYRMEYLVEDIRELIEAFDSTSCVLVGHDWGAWVAYNVAMEYPHLVDRLVVMECPVIDPAQLNYLKHCYKHPGQFFKLAFQFLVHLPFLVELVFKSFDFSGLHTTFRGKLTGSKTPGAITDEDFEVYKYYFSKPDPMAITGPFNYLRANLVTIPLQDLGGEKVTAPTLLLWGEKSFLGVAMAEMSRPYVPNLSLRVVEGASHWVQQDRPTPTSGSFYNSRLWILEFSWAQPRFTRSC